MVSIGAKKHFRLRRSEDHHLLTTKRPGPTGQSPATLANNWHPDSRFGLKSRLPIDYPSAWQVSDVGRAFHRHNLAEVIRRAVLPCCHVCQSIPQLRMYGTESHSWRTLETGEPKAESDLMAGNPCGAGGPQTVGRSVRDRDKPWVVGNDHQGPALFPTGPR